MAKIYNDAKDKNVAAVIIYGVGGDGKAYKDAEGKIQFKTSELEDAFFKRALIHYGTDLYYAPTNFIIASKVGKITFAIAGSDGKTEFTTLAAIAD